MKGDLGFSRKARVGPLSPSVALWILFASIEFISHSDCQIFDENDFYIRPKGEARILSETHNLYDPIHGVKMGIPDDECDDGKTNLEVDWDSSPVNYTCYTPKNLLPAEQKEPLLECEDIPEDYRPKHYCMSSKIEYDSPFPTHAGHRPLWAMFGEYKFLPPQRWSHNIEHGSVVMLYHPCTNPQVVKKVKKIIRACIRKHVISPSNMVPETHPMVLIAWGCRLHITSVDETLIKDYIKKHALHGPEGNYSKEGQYDHLLLRKASIPKGSNYDDAVLCP